VVERSQRRLAVLNAVGGVAVLASYGLVFRLAPEARGALWGGVPEGMRALYTVNMLLAAAGYFPFTFLLLFRTSGAELARATGLPFSALHAFYALVLFPSALWLPLTAVLIRSPSPAVWTAVRADLLLVGIGSAGLLYALTRLALHRRGALAWLGVAGAVPFFVQTAILDALVWPAFYPAPV
jgi:hypothetical protein